MKKYAKMGCVDTFHMLKGKKKHLEIYIQFIFSEIIF